MGDAQKLLRDFGISCEGMVDLSEEANLRLCGPGSARQPEKWSLAREHTLPFSLATHLPCLLLLHSRSAHVPAQTTYGRQKHL